jgi:adenylosuccinate synthase
MDQHLAFGQRLGPHVTNVSVVLDKALKAGGRILLEGAQGTHLDIDHGTYPFVTSSNTIAGNACGGVGVGPNAIAAVIGIVKAYTTRVGAGPFPTELNDAIGDTLQRKGAEFGATTGRKRRCGWLDVVLLRNAVRLNGLTGLAVTKLDVLTGLESLQICTGYRCKGRLIEDFPASLNVLSDCQPVYETLPGWREEIAGVRFLEDLPENARNYLKRIAQLTETPLSIVSVGPGRDQNIMVETLFT